MAKRADLSKERYWRGVIERQASSGESIRGFCARQGIHESQFHCWRRVIRQRDASSTEHVGAKFAEVAGQRFLSVQVPASMGAPLEVVHPTGCVVRVPAVFDASALRRVLDVLEPRSAE